MNDVMKDVILFDLDVRFSCAISVEEAVMRIYACDFV